MTYNNKIIYIINIFISDYAVGQHLARGCFQVLPSKIIIHQCTNNDLYGHEMKRFYIHQDDVLFYNHEHGN